MMHFRERALIADEKQAAKHGRKYSKWRKGKKPRKRFKKYAKVQDKYTGKLRVI